MRACDTIHHGLVIFAGKVSLCRVLHETLTIRQQKAAHKVVCARQEGEEKINKQTR